MNPDAANVKAEPKGGKGKGKAPSKAPSKAPTKVPAKASKPTATVVPYGIRIEFWKVLRMCYTVPSGSEMYRRKELHFKQGNKVEVRVRGSSEIEIGKKGCNCPWTLLNYFSVSVDPFTSTATFRCEIRHNFIMVVDWEGDIVDSLMNLFIVDDYSGHIKCCVWVGSLLSKPLPLKSMSHVAVAKSFSRQDHPDVIIHERPHSKSTKVRPPVSPAVSAHLQPAPDSIEQKQKRQQLLHGHLRQGAQRAGSKARDGVEILEDHQLHINDKIRVVEDDEASPFYRSRLVPGEVVDGPENIVLQGYEDQYLSETVEQAIRQALEKRCSPNSAFAWDQFEMIRMSDAFRVVSGRHQLNPDLWFNDNIMSGCLNLFATVPQTTTSGIHFHDTFTSVNLYIAGRSGTQSLRDKALAIAVQTRNFRVMSTKRMSIMLVNLYSDHWYVLVIYTYLKRIDCLNWFSTSAATVKLLSRLLHVYLWAHDFFDNNFSFVASEWVFCVIREGRVPSQLNGRDCGPFSIRAIEYLIVGVPLSFTQATMDRYRFKILLALRLQNFPWLVSPQQPLVEADVLQRLSSVVAAPDRTAAARVEQDPELVVLRNEAREARRLLTETMNVRRAAEAEEELWSQAY